MQSVRPAQPPARKSDRLPTKKSQMKKIDLLAKKHLTQFPRNGIIPTCSPLKELIKFKKLLSSQQKRQIIVVSDRDEALELIKIRKIPGSCVIWLNAEDPEYCTFIQKGLEEDQTNEQRCMISVVHLKGFLIINEMQYLKSKGKTAISADPYVTICSTSDSFTIHSRDSKSKTFKIDQGILRVFAKELKNCEYVTTDSTAVTRIEDEYRKV